MSSIGFDSCFYDRLDHFSRSLNHVLLAAKGKHSVAGDVDWTQTVELVRSLSTQSESSLAATSVAACLQNYHVGSQRWDLILRALESRHLDQATTKTLVALAWSLDEERATVLMRMRQGHA